jgi:5-(aminomethyl)-3-furanmethanol phosphate kinase
VSEPIQEIQRVDMSRTVVVKVGGSLLGWPEFPSRLRLYLDRSRHERQVLIVGGGRAADLIRELDALHNLGESRSHALALRALDLTAHLVAALVPGLSVIERPDELDDVWRRGRVPLLAPRWFMEMIDRNSSEPLLESWEITTDSIAARVALHLSAEELRMLKSRGAGGLKRKSRAEAALAGLVDPGFPRASASCPRVAIVNLRADPPTIDYLEG